MSETNSSRCFTQHAPFEGPPLIQNGKLNIQTHDIGWIVAGVFTIIATGVSVWLISKHLMWYTKKRQQRYIVRILMMVPIYAIISLASYVWWNHAIPITLIRDSYESFVLYSFFYLLLQYVSPTSEGQKEVFRHVVLEKWMFPLGFVKYRPPDGLYFLQLMKWGVLQYSVVRPTTTLAAVILDGVGLYCEDSWSPGWGHLYITVIVSVSVSIAMYSLIQLYMPISSRLKQYQPLLKLISIKAVVFLTFWQATFLSILSMFSVVKDTPYMTAEDINTGIAALLETFEMVCFAFLHIRAFSYRPYIPENATPGCQTPRWHSLAHAIDVREMFRELWRGCVYMGKRMRGREPDVEARKRIQFAQAMGRERQFIEAKPLPPKPSDDIPYDTEDWLDEPQTRRERTKLWISESTDYFGGNFEDEVRTELKNRDLDVWNEEDDRMGQGHIQEKKSWWRAVYNRVSQGGADRDDDEEVASRRRSSRKPRRNHHGHNALPSLDSPPPLPSVTFQYSQLPDIGATVLPSSPKRKLKRAFSTSPPQYDDMPRKSKHRRASRLPKPQGVSSISNVGQPMTFVRHDIEPVAPKLEATRSTNLLGPSFALDRSDSLFGRVFASSPASRGDRTTCTLSQDTHATELMFPRSMMPPFLPEHQSSVPPETVRASSRKRLSSPPSKLSPCYPPHVSRPNIVLPMPLSPVRHPYSSEFQGPNDHGHSESDPPVQDAPNASFRNQEALQREQDSQLVPYIRLDDRAPVMSQVQLAVIPPVQVVQDIRSPDLPVFILPSPSNDRYPSFTTPTITPNQSLHIGGEKDHDRHS